MARQFLKANSDGAYRDPHSMAGIGGVCLSLWLWRLDNSVVQILFEYDQTNGFDYVPNGFAPGDLIRSYFVSGAQWSDKWNPPAATGAWHHYFFIIPGTGEGVPPPVRNQVWLDNVQQTLTVNSAVNGAGTIAASAPFTVLCRRVGGVNSLFSSGIIAELAMWSSHTMITAPAQFVRQLAAGCNPLRVRTTECIMYVPFYGVDSPEPDYHFGGRQFTLTGTPTAVRHPPTVRAMVNFQD